MIDPPQTRVSPLMAVIFRLLGYIEIIALVGTAVGLAMLYSGMDGALEILNVALSVLAGTFFLKGYEPRPGAEQKDVAPKSRFFDLRASRIIPKVGWTGCAVTTVGIQFRLLNLDGNYEMLMIGCAAIAVALVLVGIFIVSKPDRSAGLMPLVYRAVPVGLMGVYLFMNKPS